MNLAMKVAEKLPELSSIQIKELIMKTAYISDLDLIFDVPLSIVIQPADIVSFPKMLPVRSGGIVFPERLFAAVEIIEQSSSLNMQEAALLAREKILAPAEAYNEDVRAKLISFWKLRAI